MTKQKPWNNAKNNSDWWSVRSPSGFISTAYISSTRQGAIEYFINKNIRGVRLWKQAYRLGYRAVKIRIVEME